MSAVYDNIQQFFEAGGPILWAIFFVTIIMWTLIVERFWYIYRVHPRSIMETLNTWAQRDEHHSWHARKIRNATISILSLQLNQSLHIIRMLVVITPLLGLLGTVTGMLHIFNVITVLGTGNPRAISAGISMATIPTMAGLVVALSGYYFSIRLKQKANIEAQKAADLLSISAS